MPLETKNIEFNETSRASEELNKQMEEYIYEIKSLKKIVAEHDSSAN